MAYFIVLLFSGIAPIDKQTPIPAKTKYITSTSLILSFSPFRNVYTDPEIIGTAAIHIFSIIPKTPNAVALNNPN